MKSGFIEKQKERLLGQGAREDYTLLFTAGDLIHPAVAQFGGADLGESVFRDEDVVFGFEAQGAAVGMAALQYKFPCASREEQSALLLDDGDALGASARRERMSNETIEENAAGERSEGAGD